MKISVPPELKEIAISALKQAGVAVITTLAGRVALLLRKKK